MVAKRQANADAALKCKICTATEIEKERGSVRSKCAEDVEAIKDAPAASGFVTVCCASCSEELPERAFTKNQLKKATGKQKCQGCASTEEAASTSASSEQQQKRMGDLRAAAKVAEATGTPLEKVKAMAKLSAAEAEMVTGLKPVILGRQRGKGGRGKGGGKGKGGK